MEEPPFNPFTSPFAANATRGPQANVHVHAHTHSAPPALTSHGSRDLHADAQVHKGERLSSSSQAVEHAINRTKFISKSRQVGSCPTCTLNVQRHHLQHILMPCMARPKCLLNSMGTAWEEQRSLKVCSSGTGKERQALAVPSCAAPDGPAAPPENEDPQIAW